MSSHQINIAIEAKPKNWVSQVENTDEQCRF